jgi:hypothetical protein
MACSFVFGAPRQLGLLAGLEHGRTIPLADLENTLRAIVASRELPQSQLSLGSFAIGSANSKLPAATFIVQPALSEPLRDRLYEAEKYHNEVAITTNGLVVRPTKRDRV